MSSQSFCHIGTNSEYSVGTMRLDEYLTQLKKTGHKYASLIDVGNLAGSFDFSLKCQELGISSIIGVTLNMEPSDRLNELLSEWRFITHNKVTKAEGNLAHVDFSSNHQKEPPHCKSVKDSVRRVLSQVPRTPSFELTLIAKDAEGFRTLSRLVSESSAAKLSDDNETPVCSWEILRKHLTEETRSHLIVLTGCGGGELTYQLRLDQALSKLKRGSRFKVFRDQLASVTTAHIEELRQLSAPKGLYIEIFNHDLGYEQDMKSQWLQLSRLTDIPLVASSNAHYLKSSDFEAHIVVTAIRNSLSYGDLSRARKDTKFHLMDDSEFLSEFQGMGEAIQNTMAIARECEDFELEVRPPMLPSFPVEDPYRGLTLDEVLKKLSEKGLVDRFGESILGQAEYKNRLDYELRVIKKMGFSGYFLIQADIVSYSRKERIPVGPGRGSGAGSLVSYALRITDIDPIVWKLSFERFLNPERISLPDFDIDYCHKKREWVISYVCRKYGSDKVVRIGTHGRFRARKAIKDVARIFGDVDYEAEKLTKMFPDKPDLTLTEVFDQCPDVVRAINRDSRLMKVRDMALKIEGLISGVSMHASGVVISDEIVSDVTPTYVPKKGDHVITQYEMKPLEKAGLVKFDFLGSKTLTVIDDTCHQIRASYQPDFSIDDIPMDDPETCKLIADGHTVGLFQVKSDDMASLARRLKPTEMEHIVALIALNRPGPMGLGMDRQFVKNKQNPASITYPHPLLEPILKDTYGIIVYQEQVQSIAVAIAGYTMGEADSLRRAMGKKIIKEMEQHRSRFLDGAAKTGVDAKKAEEIFNLIAEFAKYGFNRSHSVAYAITTYQTAYLKCHYPRELMVSLMNLDMSDKDKMHLYINECQRMGITVNTPSLSHSSEYFSVSKTGSITYGLYSIKGIRKQGTDAFIEQRGDRPFKDIWDFIERIGFHAVSKGWLKLMIQSGGMDEFGYARSALLKEYPFMISHSKKYHSKSKKDKNQDKVLDKNPKWYERLEQKGKSEGSTSYKDLVTEKTLLGGYCSGHILDNYQHDIPQVCKAFAPVDPMMGLSSLVPDGGGRRLIAFLEKLTEKRTKHGKRMWVVKLMTRSEDFTAYMFQEDIERHKVIPSSDRLVVVECQISKTDMVQVTTIWDALNSLKEARELKTGALRQ